MRDPLGRTPVTIVTGFLGSGKTTLLNHLLTSGTRGRVAALVNDFGAIDIDAALVTSIAEEVVQLANGCICCTINGDLLAAVERVLKLDPPVDRIVVETTGLADPLPVGLTFLQTGLRVQTVLEAVVTVIDCANFALDLFKADAAMAQILHADILILNKVDIAGEQARSCIEQRVSVLKPRARVLSCSYGCIQLAAIIDNSSESSLSIGQIKISHTHLLDDGFVAHAFRLDRPLSARALQSWLDKGLPKGVFRAKGLFDLDRLQARYVFQFCGGRADFQRYEGPVDRTGIVFIGQNLDATDLRNKIEECRVRGA